MDLEDIPTSELLLEGEQPLPSPPQGLWSLPGLQQLLEGVGRRLGGEGISPPLREQLQEAEGSLDRARGLWLHLELIWSLLGELVRDPQNLEPKVLQGLEQQLTWAQLRRGPQKLSELVPPPKPPPLLPRLLPELQRRLRQKRQEIQNFLLGGPKNPQIHPKIPPQHPPKPQNPQNAPNLPKIPQNLGGILRSQRLQLQQERRRERLLREELERVRGRYPEVLSHCLALLSQLCSMRQLQAHLDKGRGLYLQAKAGATLLKTRMEELRVLMDTYPPLTVEAHRRIRALLSESLSSAQAEAAIVGTQLAALRGLGPEFRQLALELGQIQQESAWKRSVLSRLRPLPQ